MSPPAPPHPLENHCSVIYNNTLYVYSPQAFQSLPLESGAQWNQEAMGISLTGSTCDLGWVEGDSSRPAMFVVGGSTNGTQYPGLQRYSFLDRNWTTITPIVSVTENRQHHGSAFLNATSQLFVYGGSQDGTAGLSTQTFLISTVAPYGVQAFESSAPPVTDPIVLPWNETSAVMVGGSATNTAVFTFTPQSGWQYEGVSLTAPIVDQASSASALLTLADGSKVIETFDMSKAPNTVNSSVLLNPGGNPASYGETPGSTTSSTSASTSTAPSRKRKRDLTLSNFPTYNSSLAPQTTRTGISLAQGSNGYIVISGGNDQDPLCIFDQSSNGWLNASQLLQAKPSTVTVGGPGNITSSSAPTTSAQTKASSDHHPLIILGAVLGSLFGVIALCIITLLLLRYLKKRKQGQHKRRASEFPDDKKPTRRSTSFSFHEAQDQSLQPFSSAGMPMGRSPVPSASAAFFKEIEDRAKYAPARPEPSNLTRSALEGTQAGPSSKSRPLILPSKSQDTSKSMESSGVAEASSGEVDPSLKQTGNRKTDEGWSKYFQGNNAINLTDGRSTYDPRTSRSDYRGSAWAEQSALAQPRSPREDTEPVGSGFQFRRGNVPFGSPSLEHPSTDSRGMGLAVSEGISPRISGGGSVSSLSSTVSQEEPHDGRHDTVDYDKIGDAYSSGIPASIHDDQIWNAVGNGFRTGNRRSSSNYTQSYTSGGGVRDTQLSSFPAPGSGRPRWTAESGEVHPGFPAPITNTTQGRGTNPYQPSPQDVRDYFGPNPNRSNTPSDVSWLNLGNNR